MRPSPNTPILGVLCCAALLAGGCSREPEGPRVLRMAYPYPVVTLDPHAHANSVTRGVLGAVYEGLVEFERGFPVRPQLSDHWSNPDDRTWRLHVRPGVLFHDGRELTAADVAASIQRAHDSVVGGAQLHDLESVRVDPVEPRIVEITTSRPSPMLLTRLESVAIVPQGFDPARPVGTGPYLWKLGSEDGPIALERWDGYWHTLPDFSEAVIEFLPVATALAAVEGPGTLDVVASVDVGSLRQRSLPEGWQMVASPAVTTAYLGINLSRAPLDDLEVRRAIDLAIDRPSLVTEAFPEGTARAAWSLVPHDIVGFSPDLRRSGSDRAAARTMLDTANAAEFRVLRLAHNRERFAEVADQLARTLGSVGLRVEPAAYGFDEFHGALQSGHGFDLFLFNWTFRVAEATRFFDLLVHSRDPVRGLGSYNATAFADPLLDRALAEATRESRMVDRIEGLQRVLLEVDAARVYLPLYRPSGLSVVREELLVAGFSCPAIRPQDVRILYD